MIGGGAAGIAIALRLAGAGLTVLMFESGGMEPSAEGEALAEGSHSGLPYFELNESRVRAFGGSTFRWGARSAPVRPIDFEQRNWVSLSGWPFGPEELAPYHSSVAELIGLRMPFDFGAGVFKHMRRLPPTFDASLVDVAAFQFGKNLIFGESFAREIQAVKNVKAYLNACVTQIVLSGDRRRAQSVRIETLNGKKFTAKARAFILAAGGIENPRLLLNWDDGAGKTLCNSSGLVGRCFMEHPTLTAGAVRTQDQNAVADIFSPGLVDGRFVETGLTPSPQRQRSEKILNAVACARLVVSADATQALREIIWNAKHRKIPMNLQWYKNEWLRERVMAILRDPLSIPLNILRHMLGRPKRFKADSVVLEVRSEQAPNPDSRITLSDTKDAFGLRRAHLHWEMTKLEKRTMRETATLFDRELRRLNLGAVEFSDWIKTDELVWSDDMVGGHHHMGTTRMSVNPSEGVVDPDCKAHDLDNLYIAGCSVFPTSSFVNPTFTMLCLAQRLADHLKARLLREKSAAGAYAA
ncbi:MAG: GMC family oxidoreductase [Parvularculaceae bacterium]